MKMTNPCIYCVSYAICNSALKLAIEIKANQYKKRPLTHYIIALSINETLTKCSLINKYIKYIHSYKDNADLRLSTIIIKETIDIFKLNSDTTTG